jgi:hypothetical protein
MTALMVKAIFIILFTGAITVFIPIATAKFQGVVEFPICIGLEIISISVLIAAM